MTTGARLQAEQYLPVAAVLRLRYLKHRYRGSMEYRWLARLCDRRHISVDAGANTGLFAHALGTASRVCYAFEANPTLQRYLRRAHPRRTRVFPFALSDRIGTATFSVPKAAAATGHGSLHSTSAIKHTEVEQFEVQCETLDNIIDGTVGFIKIDVEGHEQEVLSGAQHVLQRDAPSVLVEAEDRHRPGSITAVRDLLTRLGYKGFYPQNNTWVPVERFDAAQLQAPGRDPYINNFLYVRRPRAIDLVHAHLGA